MKITESQLRRIIREELRRQALEEADLHESFLDTVTGAAKKMKGKLTGAAGAADKALKGIKSNDSISSGIFSVYGPNRTRGEDGAKNAIRSHFVTSRTKGDALGKLLNTHGIEQSSEAEGLLLSDVLELMKDMDKARLS